MDIESLCPILHAEMFSVACTLFEFTKVGGNAMESAEMLVDFCSNPMVSQWRTSMWIAREPSHNSSRPESISARVGSLHMLVVSVLCDLLVETNNRFSRGDRTLKGFDLEGSGVLVHTSFLERTS